jgi:hypothetical protein
MAAGTSGKNQSHVFCDSSISSDDKASPKFTGAPMNRKLALFLSFILLLLMIPSSASAQAWSGILDSSRAIDWRNVPSVSFAIPSGSWSQCATTACTTLTAAGTGATAAQINAAIASAPANTFVKLGTGTFSLSSCIDWAGHSHVVLRGNGPLNTIIKFTAGCGGYSGGTDVAMRASVNIFDQSASTQPGASNALTLTGTAGSASGGPTGPGLYPQGATQITVSGVGSDKPHVGTMLFIDQANEIAPAAGWLQCSAGSCSANGANNGRLIAGLNYAQVQAVIVTNTSGSTYTISPGLYANNMRFSQAPGAWWNFSNSLCTQCGAENLTFDHTATASSNTSAINILDCYQCWLENIRDIYGGRRNHIYLVQSEAGVIRDSYFFQSFSKSSGGGYGIDPVESSDYLIENNIFDEVPAPIVGEQYCGFIVGYNFTWNNNPGGSLIETYPSHDPGSMMNLYEGNYINAISQDTQHGSSPTFTYFRNDIPGQQPVPVDVNTGGFQNQTPFELQALQHGTNIIGNTLGIITCSGGTYNGRPADENSQCTGGSAAGAAWHIGYETSPATSSSNCYRTIYTLGWSFGCSASGAGSLVSDTGVENTLMRWGNYDTVHAAVQWNSSEVPTTGIPFLNGNPVPATHTLPASFYYNSKPAWYLSPYNATLPFPPIGPDVTGGDLAGLGGHAYRNPARLCYQNTAQDSTNYPSTAIIKFDASNCYGTGTASGPPPAAPTSLAAVVQ